MKSCPNLSEGGGKKRKYSMVLYQAPPPSSRGETLEQYYSPENIATQNNEIPACILPTIKLKG